MARIRTVKPEFWRHNIMAREDDFVQLLALALLNYADDHGYFLADPALVRGEVMPFRDDIAKISRSLARLSEVGWIELREHPDRGLVGRVTKWAENQRVDHPRDSKIKDLFDIAKVSRNVRESLAPDMEVEVDVDVEVTTPATSRDSQADSGQPAAGAVPAEAGKAPPSPDPAVVAHVDALRVGLAVGTDEHGRAGELWGVLHANGCKGTASHPAVIEMVRDGVNVPELKRAITEARKTQEGALNPAYLAAIIERLRTEKPTNAKAQAWATDDGATEAKARELGLWPAKSGESYHDLRNRIRAKIAKGAEERVR